MKFTDSIRSITLKTLEALKNADKEIGELKSNSRNFSQAYYDEQLKRAQEKRDAIIRSGRNEILNAIEEFSAAVLLSDTPSGADLTPDAALLTSGIELAAEDIERIWDKHPNNRTMQRLLSEYAAKRGLDISHRFISGENMAAAAQEMQQFFNNAVNRPEYADIWKDPDYYAQALPEALQGQ